MSSRRAVVAILALACVVVGCRQDMHDQARYEPFEGNPSFADGRASRPVVPGTVARGHLDEDDAIYRGLEGDQVVERNPLQVDMALLERGRERFEIYCSPCHDRVGYGRGMIVQRGYKQPSSFHVDRLRDAPDGYFFQAITNGFGVMPSYALQTKPHDRWAIIAYIRALQLSQFADIDELNSDELRALEGSR